MIRAAVLLALLLVVTPSHAAIEVSFDELKKNPARFHGKTVNVTGLIEIGGIRNNLWRDAHARRGDDCKTAITVLDHPGFYPGTNKSARSSANLHFVVVTGIVDTGYHGMFGGESFGILLKKLHVLPAPRQKQFLVKLDWIRNDTDHLLSISLKTGPYTQTFDLGPLEEEAIMWDPPSVLTVTVESTNRHKRSASFKWRKDYFDAEKRCRYFRITTDRILPVLPAEGRRWKLPPTPERD